MLSLYDYQGTTRTASTIEHVHRKTPTGFLLLQCIEDLVMETGLYGHLWDMPFEEIRRYVQKHSLIYNMLEFNFQNDIKITLQHEKFEAQRVGDLPVMKLASAFYHGQPNKIRGVQRVCMCLGVIHLSDICSADGKNLDQSFLSSSPTPRCNLDLDWPENITLVRMTALHGVPF